MIVSRRGFLKAGVIVTAVMHETESSGFAAVPDGVKALVFDTFGTVVDWRSSVAAEVAALAKQKGLPVDAAQFADAWRAGYGPSMNRVRTRRAAVDEARRAAPDDARSDPRRFQDSGVVGDRESVAESRLASAASVAGCGRRADAAEEEVHHRAAVERQHLADDGPGEALGLAVGRHPGRRARAPLQAGPRGVSVGRRHPRSCSRPK